MGHRNRARETALLSPHIQFCIPPRKVIGSSEINFRKKESYFESGGATNSRFHFHSGRSRRRGNPLFCSSDPMVLTLEKGPGFTKFIRFSV